MSKHLLKDLFSSLSSTLYKQVIKESDKELNNNLETIKKVLSLQKVKINDYLDQYKKIKEKINKETKDVVSLCLKIETLLKSLLNPEYVNKFYEQMFLLEQYLHQLSIKIKE